MSEWQFFKLSAPRPEDAVILTEEHRAALERSVSSHVASLLARYGKLTDCEPYMPEAAEQAAAYDLIELAPIKFEDESEITIFQMPPEDLDSTETGKHYMEHLSYTSGLVIGSFVTYDPSLNLDPAITYNDDIHRGMRVEIDVLQEMFEMLGITLSSRSNVVDPNYPPIDTSLYPRLSTRGYRDFEPPAYIEDIYPRIYYAGDREIVPPPEVRQWQFN